MRPDVVHRMTRTDLLERNADLIRKAAALLAERPPHAIGTSRERNADGVLALRVTTENISRLDIFCNDRPWRSITVADESLLLDLATLAADLDCDGGELELRGYDRGELVAVRREPV